MSHPPAWYLQQAEVLRGRSEELRLLRQRLADAPLISLLDYAGDDTWQCPAADGFRHDVLIHQGQILDAIDDLLVNELGLGYQADERERQAAAEHRRLDEQARAAVEASRSSGPDAA